MRIPFQYRSISKEFIAKLSDMAQDGQSTVLLGPRYGGKRQVMYRIYHALSKAEAGPVVWLKFLNDPPVSNAACARSLIHSAALEAQPGLALPEGGDLLDAIDELHRDTQNRVVLIAANVDGIAHHLARQFLEGVRKRVEERWLVAVLSGEDDFRDLVYGPNSEFSCANQFVLQGFAEDEFDRFINRYLSQVREEFKFSREKRHELWDYTGGSTYLVRMILWSLIEKRVRAAGEPTPPVETLDVRDLLKMVGIPGTFGAHVFRHAMDLIAREPECWDDLQRLINREAIVVERELGPPGRLELAGIAIRDGRRLRFASKLMESVVKQHYDHRRFGDLYASVGDWDQAFAHYTHLSLEETMRPSGMDDKAAIDTTINALCAALHSKAAEGIEAVQQLFEKGCRYLLGFRDIAFWQWQLVPRKDGMLNSGFVKQLPKDPAVRQALFQLGAPLDKCALAATLPAVEQDKWGTVVVGDFEKRTFIPRDRYDLTAKVLNHFRAAYTHAVNVEKTKRRLQVRDKHVQIITSIVDALGGEVINAHQVITMAARELRKLGYRRVLFCLVDPKRKKIQGVLDDCDDKRVDVAAETDYPLDNPDADLQPFVINTRQPKRVPDARLEPLANLSVVDRTKMKAEAIVPILNPDDIAIGTIHIERNDGTVPRQDEVDDLMLFGRQLAVAIEQSDRVNLLQSALDKIPEPVVIIDSRKRVRYANKVAGDLLDVPLGWQSQSKAKKLSGVGAAQILEYLRKSFSDHKRRVRHFTGIGNDPNYHGAVLLDKIQDWRAAMTGRAQLHEDWHDQTVGTLLHIEDLNYFYQLFDAFPRIAEANDIWSAMESMLKAMKELGHVWGRLYVLDEENNDRLISKLCFGQMLPQDQEDFNRGEVVLQLHSAKNPIAWKCIDQGQPLVFCWNKQLEDRATGLTEHGLRFINVNPPVSPPQTRKQPGDFWIDYPLLADGKVLGKMTLHCRPDFRPEDFEMLKAFSGSLLAAVLRRENEFKRREEMVKKAADDTLGLTAHNLNSQMPILSKLLSDYQRLERLAPPLKEVNLQFKSDLQIFSDTIRRMKERLGPLALKPETFDVVEMRRQALYSFLARDEWELTDAGTAIEVHWDRHLIRMALIEMLQNSKDFIAEGKPLRVSVRLTPEVVDGVEWVKIIYRDNGPGVPLEYKRRIFDQFFSHRPGMEISTGVGLRYVQRVVQAHGGSIREVGQFGEGAEFEIRIPRIIQAH